MPLVRRDIPAAPGSGVAAESLPPVAALTSPEPDERWNAARALGMHPQAVPALAAALETEQVPRVREAIMTALMRIGDAASVTALLPYLRSADAALRAGAIEALQSLPQVVAPFVPMLLGDDDSDVRILAIELLRGFPAAEATRLLCGLLNGEEHPNVCASAIDALAEVGTSEALPVLRRCAERFAGTAFLPFAITVAIGRIADAKARD